MYGAADVALCMAGEEGTVEVVWGAHTTRAYFDAPGTEVLGGAGLSNDYAITLGMAALPGIKRGETVTVAGQAYSVASAMPLDDGVMMRVALRKA